jgi:hypothetical protein
MTYEINENIISLLVSISALLISIIALFYTIRAFILKSGQKFRCDIGITSSIDCSDKYISSITLENLKDRASVIFSVYIRYGLNNYLLIEDFSNSPLILKPFEVYYKEYDPILFYSLGVDITNLDKLIDDTKVKNRIVLATTNGKYIVKYNTKRWDPIIPFFKNYYTAIIKPIRKEYKDKNYGDNVKYLVVLTHKKEKEQVISLYKDDYRHKRFPKFQITKESLESQKKLETFLKKQKKEGNLSFEEIGIIDYSEEVDNIRSKYGKEIRDVVPYNFFYYKILGRILTIRDKYNMNIKNKRYKKKAKQKLVLKQDCE